MKESEELGNEDRWLKAKLDDDMVLNLGGLERRHPSQRRGGPPGSSRGELAFKKPVVYVIRDCCSTGSVHR